ncbi:MAG: hypothetical protein DRN81_02175 [Thermoproteota archaeon]|nr:MAG: hypothetical protein DRN81_02175 [Candidatus Korarchaeota archaeon]
MYPSSFSHDHRGPLLVLTIALILSGGLASHHLLVQAPQETLVGVPPSATVLDVRKDFSRSSDPITVDGDSQFGLPIWGGSGTQGDPWYIEGLTINMSGTSGNCIEIRNTRAFFEIRNCVLVGGTSGYGIVLSNVTNGGLLNNTVIGHTEYAIHLSWTHSVNLTRNTCESSFGGVEVIFESSLVGVMNNTVKGCTYRGLYYGPTTSTNLVKWNSLIDNTFNAVDDSSDSTNTFDSNFWSDYQGVDESPRDAVGDTPYLISGDSGASDPHPMMIPPTYPPIVWNEDPTDQIAMLGKDFLYDLNATAYAGVDRWWLNDTVHFTINGSGVVTNNSILPEGNVYGLNVHLNDTYGNTLGAEFEVRVQDINPPDWTEEPTDQIVEFGDMFVYDLNATDPSGIDTWLLNDTSIFSIDSQGQVMNTTPLPVGVYPLRVEVNDTNGLVASAVFRVIVQDTIAPGWIEGPVDQIVEFGDPFRYDLNATDVAGIDAWWLEDTTYFQVDSEGVITNRTVVDVGTYYLHVHVNDTHGLVSQAIVEVVVEDTTAPVWTMLPSDQTLECGETLTYQLAAWDLSGTDHWTLNDTTNFVVTSVGQIINLELVLPGVYALRVTAYDPYGNSVSATLTITVQDTRAPTWSIAPTNQTLEFGDALSYTLSAYDPTGIELWWLNDTSRFSISQSGVLTNTTPLEVGRYNLLIGVNDTYDHARIIVLAIIVVDTTPPQWVVEPTDQVIQFGSSLSYQLQAIDRSGIGDWSLNDTVRFHISEDGLLTSVSGLNTGTYGLRIRVTDSHGNTLLASITVTVQPAEGLTSLQLAGIGVGVGAVGLLVLGVALFRRRSLAG